jgi:hypothetical protein
MNWDQSWPKDCNPVFSQMNKAIDYPYKREHNKHYSSVEESAIRGLCKANAQHLCYGMQEHSPVDMIYGCKLCKYRSNEFPYLFMHQKQLEDILAGNYHYGKIIRKMRNAYNKLRKLERTLGFFKKELGDVYTSVMKEYRRVNEND